MLTCRKELSALLCIKKVHRCRWRGIPPQWRKMPVWERLQGPAFWAFFYDEHFGFDKMMKQFAIATWAAIVWQLWPAPAVAEDVERAANAGNRSHVWVGEITGPATRVVAGSVSAPGERLGGNGTVSVGGKSSPHALSMTPGTLVEYALGGQYAALHVTVAIDDSSNASQRQVVFRVWCDGQIVWESQGLRRPGEQQPCVVEVEGAQTLALSVDYHPGDPGPENSVEPVWVEPRLQAEPLPATDALPIPAAAHRREAREWADYRRGVTRLLLDEKFEQLDQQARQARQSEARFMGESRLAYFYRGLFEAAGADGAVDYEHAIGKCRRWVEHSPHEISARIALSQAFIGYAWHARGGGWAKDVSQQQWADFHQRMAEAKRVLQQAMSLQPSDPYRYNLMMDLAIAEGWPQEKVFDLVEASFSDQPAFDQILVAVARYLQPRWYGKPGEVHQFADRWRRRLGQGRGDKVYAAIAMKMFEKASDPSEFFEKSPFDYQHVRQGLFEIIRETPSDNQAVQFAIRFACAQRDRETAYRLFNHGVGAMLGHRPGRWPDTEAQRDAYLWSRPEQSN